MQYTGVNGEKDYTLTVQRGKVRSILVEVKSSYDRKFYQRTAKMGLVMDEKIFEETVLAICKKNLVSWMDLFDAIWTDKIYGQELIQRIFEKHLYL